MNASPHGAALLPIQRMHYNVNAAFGAAWIQCNAIVKFFHFKLDHCLFLFCVTFMLALFSSQFSSLFREITIACVSLSPFLFEPNSVFFFFSVSYEVKVLIVSFST